MSEELSEESNLTIESVVNDDVDQQSMSIAVADLLQIKEDRSEKLSERSVQEDSTEREEGLREFALEDIKEPEEQPIAIRDLLQIKGDREELGSTQAEVSKEDEEERKKQLDEFALEDIKEPEDEQSNQVVELLQIKGDHEEVGSNQSGVSNEDILKREEDLTELLQEEEEDILSNGNIPLEPKVAVYSHIECTKHYIPDHPEQPARVTNILNSLKNKFSETIEFRTSSLGTREHAALFHTNSVIKLFEEKCKIVNDIYINTHKVKYESIDSDTKIMKGTYNAVYRAVGSVIDAVDHIYAEKSNTLAIDTAFCCIRPPGHHAETNKSGGFCFYNNVGIGAKYAQTKYGVNKVAVLDFDVHHGNGTEDGFLSDSTLFYGSTHEKDIYPCTGVDPTPYIGEKVKNPVHRRIVNRTLTSGEISRKEFKIKWIEILNEMELFQPDLIIISAGFDAHDDDPLADVQLIDEDFVWITKEILKSGLRINRLNPPKIFSVLEGGYDLNAIARSATLHVGVLKEGYHGILQEMKEENDPFDENNLNNHHNGDEVEALQQYLKEIGLN